jgi:hypothetical protein
VSPIELLRFNPPKRIFPPLGKKKSSDEDHEKSLTSTEARLSFVLSVKKAHMSRIICCSAESYRTLIFVNVPSYRLGRNLKATPLKNVGQNIVLQVPTCFVLNRSKASISLKTM